MVVLHKDNSKATVPALVVTVNQMLAARVDHHRTTIPRQDSINTTNTAVRASIPAPIMAGTKAGIKADSANMIPTVRAKASKVDMEITHLHQAKVKVDMAADKGATVADHLSIMGVIMVDPVDLADPREDLCTTSMDRDLERNIREARAVIRDSREAMVASKGDMEDNKAVRRDGRW